MFKKLSLGCLGFVFLGFCFIVLLGVIGARQTKASAPVVAVAKSAEISAPAPDAAPIVTDPIREPAAPAPTQAPTSTPKPAPTPKSAPTATPAPTLGRIGERIESGGIALTVNSVRRAKSLNAVFQAKPGRTYLVVDVTLETGGEKAPYNPLYFKVRDGGGYEYTETFGSDDKGLKSGELGPGEKVRGTVAFDVPDDATDLVLAYQPLVLFGGSRPIRIALD
jgi:hypothetical protein